MAKDGEVVIPSNGWHALADRARQLHALIAHISDIIAVIDAAGAIQYISPSVTAVAGYESGELVGKPFAEFMHPDDLPAAMRLLADILRRPNEPLQAVYRYRHKNGGWLNIDAIARNLLGSPEIEGIVVTLRDVTAREAAQQALAYRMAFESLIMRLSSSIIALNPGEIDKGIRAALGEMGTFADADRSYLFMTSGDGSVLSCTHEWTRPGIRSYADEFQEVTARDFPWAIQCLERNEVMYLPRVADAPPEGQAERRAFEAHDIRSLITVPIANQHGTRGFVGFDSVRQEKAWPQDMVALLRIFGEIVLNVVDRRRAEHLVRERTEALEGALRCAEESELRFRQMAEHIRDLFFVIDTTTHRFLYLSPAYEEIWDRPLGLVTADQASFMEAVHPDDRAVVGAAVAKCNTTGELDLEHRIVRPDGEVRWVHARAFPIYDETGALVRSVGVAEDCTERIRAARTIQESESSTRQALEGTIQVLERAVEKRDPYTAGHERRVAELSVAIARQMQLSDDRIRGLEFAAQIHDLGKISIPAEILSKPGRLTEIEYALIKTHAQASRDILKDISFPWPIADIAWQHHERMDGTGYPRQLKGDEILLEARILAVSDVVESMYSHRPYRAALGLDKAIAEISRGRGVVFDSDVVDACSKLLSDKRFTFSF